MSDIFISYVEEDADVVESLAQGLIEAGYSCWYYQRSSLPGASYLQQISDALSQAKVVLLVLSPQTLDSHQVDKGISFAHESNKPFLPITRNLAWGDFQQRRPTWRLAVGTSVAIPIPPDGVAAIHTRIVDGLRGLGIIPRGVVAAPQPARSNVSSASTHTGLDSYLAPAAPLLSSAPSGLVQPRAAPDALPGRTAFVGRTKELEFLRTEYEAVAAGQGGRLVLISGESGVGKTRLAQEVGLYAWRKGAGPKRKRHLPEPSQRSRPTASSTTRPRSSSPGPSSTSNATSPAT
ncbi:MAG: toll/interleukin-1 receptor domain-containing protein, partial [Chloroflexi bacterium]|nr:toll/interleukin-1 receptor domain-containing protein [Chloroflexota bacterium]